MTGPDWQGDRTEHLPRPVTPAPPPGPRRRVSWRETRRVGSRRYELLRRAGLIDRLVIRAAAGVVAAGAAVEVLPRVSAWVGAHAGLVALAAVALTVRTPRR